MIFFNSIIPLRSKKKEEEATSYAKTLIMSRIKFLWIKLWFSELHGLQMSAWSAYALNHWHVSQGHIKISKTVAVFY